MLTISLRRTQAELCLHRQWLHTFSTAAITAQRSPRSRPIEAQVPRWRTRGAATKSVAPRYKIRRSTLPNEASNTDQANAAEALRGAFQSRDIAYVIKYYNALPPKRRKTLPPPTIILIVKTLFAGLSWERRQARDSNRDEDFGELVPLAHKLVTDWRAGNIIPVATAIGRILEFFKETGERDAGIEFWDWIREQDPEKGYASANVYGTAIDLLAVNGTPLADLETLFSEALERYPGDFLAYHLSPNALVPDRDQEFLGSLAPYHLMKGIMHARLLYGASRDAYLAFDALLRLWPDINHNRVHLMVIIYQVFMEERSIPEAFTIFAIACRAGTLIPYDVIRQFMTVIRKTSDLSHPVTHIHALRQMLSVMYMSIGAGGRVTSNMINELLIAMSQILRISGMEAVQGPAKNQIVAEVLEIIRKSLETFSRYGAMPGIGAFNSIITNIAGWGGDRTVISIALTDARALGLEPNHVTRRSILTAAGIVRDATLVRESWALLLKEKVDTGTWPDVTDMHILIKAATRSECTDFARKMFDELKAELPASDHKGIIAHLDAPEPDVFDDGQNRSEMDLPALFNELAKLRADIDVVEETTRTRPKIQNFNEHALPMTLYPAEAFMPESELRKFYEELSSEPQTFAEVMVSDDSGGDMSTEAADENGDVSPPADESVTEKPKPAYSPTGIPFGTLRYENWKSVNQLLSMADKHDQAFESAIDRAIATGVAPPPRQSDFTLRTDEAIVSYGISDAVRGGGADDAKSMSSEDIKSARNRILTLRGRMDEAQ